MFRILRKKYYGVGLARLRALVSYALVVALLEHVALLDLDKVAVCKPGVAGEYEHVAHLFCHTEQLQTLDAVTLLFRKELYAPRFPSRYPHVPVRVGL